jgi:EAL and modified HD-GYP domain-containing signal transduction protein
MVGGKKMVQESTVKNDRDNVQSLSIARQPIFDKRQRLWGYLLLCIGSEGPVCTGLIEADTIAANLAASAYIGLKQVTERGLKLMVDYTNKNLLDHMPYALPSDLAAVAVTRDLGLQPEMQAILTQLNQDDYTIIIRDIDTDPNLNNFYELAHVLAVDTRRLSNDKIFEMVNFVRKRGAKIMAMQLENQEIFKQYEVNGFDLFHGPFFKTADIMRLRKLSVNEIARFKLLRLMEKMEPDFPKIVEALRSDATLSFRLFSYLNSAAFGFRQKIKSIRQAVMLLGWRKLKNWLRVVLMEELNQSRHASALMFIATQRGKFLETIATENGDWGFEPDTLYLLGLFSLLDAMLQIPMTEIVDHLPLEDKLKCALLEEPNNDYLPLLQLVKALEDVKWKRIEALIRQLNLDHTKVSNAFQASIEGAIEWLEAQEG